MITDPVLQYKDHSVSDGVTFSHHDDPQPTAGFYDHILYFWRPIHNLL